MHPKQRRGGPLRGYAVPASIEEALESIRVLGSRGRLISGGTDLVLELARGERPGVDTLVDVSRIPGGTSIVRDSAGIFRFGPCVTYAQAIANQDVVRELLPLAQACLDVGSPQVRNCGTLAGALVSGRPGGDIAPVLVACEARAELRSTRGSRTIAVAEMLGEGGPGPDEMLTEIRVPALPTGARGLFVKARRRRGQAVAIANLAIVLHTRANGDVVQARIASGSDSARPLELAGAAEALSGRSLDAGTISDAVARTAATLGPTDVDSSLEARYRREVIGVMLRRGLVTLREGRERALFPESVVTLARSEEAPPEASRRACGPEAGDIAASVNGRHVAAPGGGRLTLLAWLREAVGLTGTKEGCGEGVCGSCTVEVDGKAVLACLVPAQRARGASVRTVEGLAGTARPHRLQQAFVEQGAVQCGFCTPGFLMAGAALLEEHPHPGKLAIEEAFAGNLCRCTGYHAIRRAVEQVAGMRSEGKADGDREA